MNSQANRKLKASSASTTEIHSREEGRNERRHALRLGLVAPIADRVERGGGGAEIDHGEEEGGERIDPEMRADPWQAERQFGLRRRRAEREADESRDKPDERYCETGGVDGGRDVARAADETGEKRDAQQYADAG